MSKETYKENSFEQALIERIKQFGYEYECGLKSCWTPLLPIRNASLVSMGAP